MRPPAAGLRALLAAAVLAAAAGAARAGDPDAPPPLSAPEADRLLQRAEANLVLHGLSFQDRYLQRAVGDYRTVSSRLPPAFPPDHRLVARFGVAFCIARADLPSDEALRTALGKEAGAALDAAADIDPAFCGLWIARGMLQERMGDARASVEDITRGFEGLEGSPALAPWQRYQLRLFGLLSRSRALLHRSVGREDLALKDAQAALELADRALADPATPADSLVRVRILSHVAAAQERLGYFAEAEAILRDLMKRDPANALHPYNMGMVLMGQQKYPAALDCFRRAVTLDRTSPLPHVKMAFILLVLPPDGRPDPDAAEVEADALLALSGPDSAEYRALRGELAWARRRNAEAERWFRAALEKSPSCRHALERLVRILGAEESPTPARAADLEGLKRRFEEETRRRGPAGGGMEVPRPDQTFC